MPRSKDQSNGELQDLKQAQVDMLRAMRELHHSQIALTQQHTAFLAQIAQTNARMAQIDEQIVETQRQIVETNRQFNREIAEIRREAAETNREIRREAAETNRRNDERFARIEATLAAHSQILERITDAIAALPDIMGRKFGFHPPEPRP